jgi:quinol monooxygenase YgiN
MACKEKQTEASCCEESEERNMTPQTIKDKTVIVARVTIKEGQEKAFIEIASKLVAATREEEGNLFYTFYQSIEDPLIFIVYEEYKDDDAFEAHANSTHFAAFVEATNDMMACELVIDQY